MLIGVSKSAGLGTPVFNSRTGVSRALEATMNVTQVKDAIRYMSRSDKIEIYRWQMARRRTGRAISLSGSDRVGRLHSANKSNGRGSLTTKRAAQLSGKDVDVRAIGRRPERHSESGGPDSEAMRIAYFM
jgi:hypothetical protein